MNMDSSQTAPNGENAIDTEKANLAKSPDPGTSSPLPEGMETKDCGLCQCGCVQRLEKIENEINDLRNWKARRQQLDDILSQWRDEVETWMQTTFGFTFSGTLSPKRTDLDGDEKFRSSPITDNKDVNGETDDKDRNGEPSEVPLDLSADTENVEITPDLFGHFLLDNEYSYDESGDDDDIEEMNESFDEEEEEDEVPMDNILTKPAKRRRKNDDSDSECYTISSSNESSDDDYTSDEDYEPLRKHGKGRGRGKSSIDQYKNKRFTAGSHVNNSTNNIAKTDLGNEESRKELLQHCRKRQGNIWECTVCGFMLTSFENMLLHIKYNHTSTTHTCPYCRIVVLCRSPKDAIIHQSQCKMRAQPSVSNCIKVPEPKSTPSVPTNKSSTTTTTLPTPKRPMTFKDANEEVDKFVNDILGPSSTKPNSLKNNSKKTGEPAIVTLSSDEDED